MEGQIKNVMTTCRFKKQKAQGWKENYTSQICSFQFGIR